MSHWAEAGRKVMFSEHGLDRYGRHLEGRMFTVIEKRGEDLLIAGGLTGALDPFREFRVNLVDLRRCDPLEHRSDDKRLLRGEARELARLHAIDAVLAAGQRARPAWLTTSETLVKDYADEMDLILSYLRTGRKKKRMTKAARVEELCVKVAVKVLEPDEIDENVVTTLQRVLRKVSK